MIDYTQYSLSRVGTETKDGLTYTFVLLKGPDPNHGLSDAHLKIKGSTLKRDKDTLEAKILLQKQLFKVFGDFVSQEFLQEKWSETLCPMIERYEALTGLIKTVEDYKKENT